MLTQRVDPQPLPAPQELIVPCQEHVEDVREIIKAYHAAQGTPIDPTKEVEIIEVELGVGFGLGIGVGAGIDVEYVVPNKIAVLNWIALS